MARGLWSVAALALLSVANGCTTIAVSSGATVDGSAMVSHANDCADCDWRMVYVPAMDHPKGSLRPLLDTVRAPYPRLVDLTRSWQYHPAAGINRSFVLGYIPQVEHTYALWENDYSLMNEKGLAIGETTCGAFLWGNMTKPDPKEKKEASYKDGAHFCIANLMSVALERCETARCAVETMGHLAATYGFYGEDPGVEGAGEALTVADNQGETWVFHVTGGLPEKPGSKWEGQRGALWAAQKVPDGHVVVLANNFIIREVDMEDTKNFIVHPGLLELTQEAGLWDGKGKFDFLKVMSPDERKEGKDPIPLYTTLRMWHVFNKVAPSKGIRMTDNAWTYPFSVQVDKKVTHLDVFDLFRTHYEGTEYDMTLGVLAGPFQSPNRAEGGDGPIATGGQTARGLSIPRTSYTQVCQTSHKYPKVWYAPDQALTSVFVPFYTQGLWEGGDGKFDLPGYGLGSSKTFDFEQKEKPAWWAFDFVANWMDVNWKHMSATYVKPKLYKLQNEVNDAAKSVEAKADRMGSKDAAQLLAGEHTRIQKHVNQEWWSLAGTLIVRYNDYFYNFPEDDPDQVHVLGYPQWWLEMVGFNDKSYLPNWVKPSLEVPEKLPDEDKKSAISAMALLQQALGAKPMEAAAIPGSAATSLMAGLLASLCGMLAAGVAGYHLGKSQRDGVEETYVAIAD